jgi:hypothetical protein
MLNEEHIPNEAPRPDQIEALQAEIRRLHGLLRLESQLVKDLRAESERLKPKAKARPASRVKS